MTSVFQVSLYLVVALAGLLLAIGEERLFPAPLTVPLAAVAFVINERLRWLRLTVNQANVLGVLAFVLSGIEIWQATFSDIESGLVREQQVLAGAHMLTWLTWIALFQSKQGRQYWWLLGLSVMHVAIAAILTDSGVFGGLLLIFVFLTLWTMAVYLLYLARYSFEQAGPEAGGLAFDTVSMVHTHRSQAGSPTGDIAMPWRQAGEFRGSIQLDPDERWINSRFVAGLITTSLLSLFVGLLFFVLIPRLWVRGQDMEDSDFDTPIRTVTGFTDEVQLGEIGQILESTDPVFEVHCTDAETGRERHLPEVARLFGYEEPLFRGSAMGRYEKGRWHVLAESRNVTSLLPPQRINNSVRFHYVLHDQSSRTLFAMHPAYQADIRPELISPVIDIATSILMRGDEDRSGNRLEYAFVTRVPGRVPPWPRIARVRELRALTTQMSVMPKLLALPPGLDRLQAQALQIASEASPPGPFGTRNQEAVANAILAWLRDSGQFTYTLKADVQDPTIDPVEDFLFNRKTGHCEYYASAMTLMLRAAGIPSRLISGFKGGDALPYSGRFVVQQRHAHAWVEAWVNDDWQTYDPTPFAEREESVQQIGEERNPVARLQEIFTGLWQQRVVRLTFEEQQHQLYAPVGAVLREVVRTATGPLGETGSRIRSFLDDPRRWFSPETFIGTAMVLVVLSALRRVIRHYLPEGGLTGWVWSAIVRLWNRLREPRGNESIEFYQRFTRILARHGLRRQRSQTQLEFAEAARDRLASQLPDSLLPLPVELTQLFYRVRFGNLALTEQERRWLDDRLKDLESGLKRRPPRT